MGQAVVSLKHEADEDFQLLTPAAFARDANYQLPKVAGADDGEVPGLIGVIAGEELNGETTPVVGGDGAVALVQGGEIIPDGVKGKALALYGEVAGIKLRGLKQREDAFTISTWVRFRNRPEDIMLFGQAYGSLNFRLRGTRLICDWSRGVGQTEWHAPKEAVAPGTWFHVAATYGKENALYFNGEKVESAQSLHWKKRKGNGYFADHDAVGCSGKPTAIDEYRIYDRTLTPDEIERIYRSELRVVESGAKK
jgi:hypothetical protein